MIRLSTTVPGGPSFAVEGLPEPLVSAWAAERCLAPGEGGFPQADLVGRPGEDGSAYPATAPHRLRLEAHGPTVVISGEPPREVDEGLLAAFDLALTRTFARQGVLVLHGAGFVLDERSVLALGPSGAGKSSTAAAALAAGGAVLSDDVVFLRPGEGGGVAWPGRRDLLLRCDGRFRAGQRLSPSLREAARGDGPRKQLDRRSRPDLFVDELRPDELWTLRVDPSRARSLREPLAAGPLVAEMIRSTSPLLLSEACREDAENLRPLLRAAADLPSFRVTLGADLLSDPAAAIRSLLRQAGSSLDLPSRQE